MPDAPAGDRTNTHALVSYIVDPLGGFLDRLRRELVPSCFLKAHITLLPPRPLLTTPESAWQDLLDGARSFRPFEIELSDMRIFPGTNVIHIGVGRGAEELHAMHQALNRNGLFRNEPYPYDPHITLAQKIPPEQVEALMEAARTRWAEYTGDRSFRLEMLTFVQNTGPDRWLDLGGWKLGDAESSRIYAPGENFICAEPKPSLTL